MKFNSSEEYREHLMRTVPNGIYCIKNDSEGKIYTGKLGYITYKVAMWEHFNGNQKATEGLMEAVRAQKKTTFTPIRKDLTEEEIREAVQRAFN